MPTKTIVIKSKDETDRLGITADIEKVVQELQKLLADPASDPTPVGGNTSRSLADEDLTRTKPGQILTSPVC